MSDNCKYSLSLPRGALGGSQCVIVAIPGHAYFTDISLKCTTRSLINELTK